jgi:type II secretory pathway pseudopilin PulG
MIRNLRGETIIEVTISIAILATAIIMAFATATVSTHTGVQAKEHIQAIHLAAQQADRIKAKRDLDISAIPNPAINILGAGSTYAGCSVAVGARCTINAGLAVSSGMQPCPVAVFPNGTNCQIWFELSGTNTTLPSKAHYVVRVTWNSQSGLQDTTTVDVILVDKRGFTPRNCAEADTCTP